MSEKYDDEILEQLLAEAIEAGQPVYGRDGYRIRLHLCEVHLFDADTGRLLAWREIDSVSYGEQPQAFWSAIQ